MEYTKRARRCRESEEFANDNEEEEVSSDEEANPKANQPNHKASGHGEGLPPKEGGATRRIGHPQAGYTLRGSQV